MHAQCEHASPYSHTHVHTAGAQEFQNRVREQLQQAKKRMQQEQQERARLLQRAVEAQRERRASYIPPPRAPPPAPPPPPAEGVVTLGRAEPIGRRPSRARQTGYHPLTRNVASRTG